MGKFGRRWLKSVLAVFLCLCTFCLSSAIKPQVLAQTPGPIRFAQTHSAQEDSTTHPSTSRSAVPTDWPTPQAHPLPQFLEQWQDETGGGDYFDRIQPPRIGHLIWSEFPVRISVDTLDPSQTNSKDAMPRSEGIWRQAVFAAIEDWSRYVPLKVVPQTEQAHIQIQRQVPPLQISKGDFRSRSAITRYKLYRQSQVADAPPILTHRCQIQIRPGQTADYIRAAARHELGHALGLWGHSPTDTDALYFSQVREPPSISTRDMNTLKRVYQQPTRLGWAFMQTEEE